MRRRLLNLLTGLSLLLCVAVVALWVRSNRVGEGCGWRVAEGHGGFCYTAYSGAGGIQIARYRVAGGPRYFHYAGHYQPDYPPLVGRSGTVARRLGFGFATSPQAEADEAGEGWLVFPWWSVAAATSIAPAWWSMKRLALLLRRRTTSALCPACGYDLRATPGRCPECGAETSKTTA